MRYLLAFLCVVFALFTVAQYNDPDGPLWMLIYGLVALWTGLAAFRPVSFRHSRPLLAAFVVTLAAEALYALYLWPREVSTWWENEVVREGMGMILATAALLVVAYRLWRTREAGHGPIAA